MPEVLANATEAIIAKWLVEEGATFTSGQPLAEAETEKALVEVPAEIDGILGRKLVKEGATISVGAPIAVILAVGESAADVEKILASESISSGDRACRCGKHHQRANFLKPVGSIARQRKGDKSAVLAGHWPRWSRRQKRCRGIYCFWICIETNYGPNADPHIRSFG